MSNFSDQSRRFLKGFLNHFVEEKELYNIHEIQHESRKNYWMAVDILKNPPSFHSKKMASYEQYFINNYRSVYINIICKIGNFVQLPILCLLVYCTKNVVDLLSFKITQLYIDDF